MAILYSLMPRRRAMVFVIPLFAFMLSIACSKLVTSSQDGVRTTIDASPASASFDSGVQGSAASPSRAHTDAGRITDAGVDAGRVRSKSTIISLNEHNLNNFCQQKGYTMLTGHTCLKLCRSDSDCGTEERCRAVDGLAPACWPP
jgi:hypothetical protein